MRSVTVYISELEQVLEAFTATRDMLQAGDTVNSVIALDEVIQYSPLTMAVNKACDKLIEIIGEEP